MNQDYQQVSRKNQMIQRDAESPLAQVHFFTKLPLSTIIQKLQQNLKQEKYSFQLHEDYRQLNAIINAPKYKTLVLIETNKAQGSQVQTIFTKNYKFSSNQTVKILTIPFKMVGSGLDNLVHQKDVLDLCAHFFSGDSRRIKLSRVHMIRGSKDKKLQSAKSLKKVTTNTRYDELFIFKDNEGSPASLNETAQYNRIIEVLQRQKKVQIFRTYKQLQGKTKQSQGRKYLVFGNTTAKSMKNFNKLREKKEVFDILIMGDLQPKDYLLDQNVALATNDPIDHLNFLVNNDYRSNAIEKLIQQITAEQQSKSYDIAPNRLRINVLTEDVGKKQSAINQRPASGLPSENIKKEEVGNSLNINANQPQNPVLPSNPVTAKVSQIQQAKSETSEKRKIKRLKSPKQSLNKQKEEDKKVTVSIIQQLKNENVTKQVKQSMEKEIQYNTVKEVQNTVTKEVRQYEAQAHKNTKEEQNKISKQRNINSLDQRIRISPQSPVQMMIGTLEKLSNTQTPIETIYTNKNQISIAANNDNSKTDYRDLKNPPSNIIPEMSEEYRGSNLQPENSIKITKHQSDFVIPPTESAGKEGTNTKKIMKMTHNEPAIYQASQQIIGQNKISPIDSNPSYSPMNRPISPTDYTNIYNDGGNEIKVHIHEQLSPHTETKNTQTDTKAKLSVQPPIQIINTSSFMRVDKEKQNNQFEKDPNRKSSIRMVQVYDPIGPEEVKSEPNPHTYKTIGSNNLQKIVSEGHNQKYLQQNYQKYSYPSQNGKDYYNVRTLDYHSINNEPYNNKIEISTRPSEGTIYSPKNKPQSIQKRQTNPIDRNHEQFTSIQAKVTTINNTGINLQQYQPFIRNGITVYRKRNSTVPPPDNQEYNPPKVYHYETKPVHKYVAPHYQQANNYTYKATTGIRDHSPMESTTLHIVSKPYSVQTYNAHFGEMIDSSLDKNSSNDLSELIYKGDRLQRENLKRKLNEIRQPRTQVEMVETIQYKVQSAHPSNQHLMNQSSNNLKTSEMYSDASILRRNNIKFGIKPKRPEERSESVSVTDSKNGSGVYSLNILNKKMALNRIISGQEYLEEQKKKYSSIVTKFNCFHFIIAEDMNYLIQIIERFVATTNDKVESFTGSDELFDCIRPQRVEDRYDVGLIFAKKEQIAYINSNTLLDDYYFVEIDGDRGEILEINQMNRRIVMDQTWQLPLAQKILIDSQLYQYVIHHSEGADIEEMAQTFANSEFIVQRVEGEFSSQTLEYYYCELPRMVRVYVLCTKKQLHNLVNLLPVYEQFNPHFQKQSCKLICFLDDSTNNNQLIRTHPTVTFVYNTQHISNHHELIWLAHRQDRSITGEFPIDRVFYHQKHEALGRKIKQEFPGRFLTLSYSQLPEVLSHIDSTAQTNANHKYKQRNFLILHESVNGEQIQMQQFEKVYMLGRVKAVQQRVIRALDESQLFQLLRK